MIYTYIIGSRVAPKRLNRTGKEYLHDYKTRTSYMAVPNRGNRKIMQKPRLTFDRQLGALTGLTLECLKRVEAKMYLTVR